MGERTKGGEEGDIRQAGRRRPRLSELTFELGSDGEEGIR